METTIHTFLKQAGVPPTYLGYFYLSYAISLIMQDRTYLFHATKCLYPDIATHFVVSSASVERNLRTLLDIYWNTYKGKRLEEITGYHTPYKPTSREFIAIVVDYLAHS